MNFNIINVQTLQAERLSEKNILLDVLRLDKIHPVISGNKWFKLKYYLKDAIMQHKTTVATFGGAWSNHIAAVAFACKEAALKSIGIIRGEQSDVLSETLQKAVECGMELHFVSRKEYREKTFITQKYQHNNWYWINEGGYGLLGVKGAAEMLNTVDISVYSHIVAAVGTGTMLAGLLSATEDTQKIIGISCMKGNLSLEKQILSLITVQSDKVPFQIIHDYHFGGYGKHPLSLINFINEMYSIHQLPLDIIYTGKTLYAITELAKKDFFEQGSRILMIHSGGLQGNKSLPAQALVF